MGNDAPKKQSVTKNQIEIACMKAKIHMQMIRDRKNQQIIKGEKQLVNKLHCQSRSKAEQMLIMERVVNGLKYTQGISLFLFLAVSQLISYSISLKSMAGFLAENRGCTEKIQPWLTPLYTLEYAADQLGLSTLYEYKNVMRSLCMSDPMQAQHYISPQIKQLLSPTPTFYQVNIYVLEMCLRNNMLIEQVNLAGHKFNKIDASVVPKDGPGPYGTPGNDIGGNGDNGTSNPYFGGQGNGDFPGNGGVNTPPKTPGLGEYNKINEQNKYKQNPYKKQPLTFDKAPQYFSPSDIKQSNEIKPKQFINYDNIQPQPQRKTIQDHYPEVNPNSYKQQFYLPKKNNNNQNNNSPKQKAQNKSPTISQLMKDFGLK